MFVPLIAAMIGAAAGVFSSVWITRKQLLMAFDKAKLETLHLQQQKLEQLLVQFAALTMKVEGGLTGEQLGSKCIDRFIQKAALTRPYYHYLPKELCSEISRLSNTISSFIVAAKMGETIDDSDARRGLESIEAAESRLDDELTKTLRVLQAGVMRLTSQNPS